jgi:hypothetical protein
MMIRVSFVQSLLSLDNNIELPPWPSCLWLCLSAPPSGLVADPCPISIFTVSTIDHQACCHTEAWPRRREFETIVDGISDALDFSLTIGVESNSTSYERGGGRGTLREVDFYTRCTACFRPFRPTKQTNQQPRGLDARLRRSAHPRIHEFEEEALLQYLGTLPLDWGPHSPAHGCSCGIL